MPKFVERKVTAESPKPGGTLSSMGAKPTAPHPHKNLGKYLHKKKGR